jgi:steroid delta-isomerase
MLRIALAATLLLAGVWPSVADDAADIRATLELWRDDFNAGRADPVCALFSRDVIAQVRGVPERDYDQVCRVLQDALADKTKQFSYALDIKEVVVAGDLAVVRLKWTLKIAPPVDVTSVEQGMDIFRRQSDGSWKIIRYQVYEEP